MYTMGVKNVARNLRRLGFTTTEIQRQVGLTVPKATMSYWFRGLELSPDAQWRLHWARQAHMPRAREKSVETKKRRRAEMLAGLMEKYRLLGDLSEDQDTKKIILSMLYLGEGSKHRRQGGPCFSNSDPRVIQLYLNVLRSCFKLDESKFRVTVMCRADQDVESLNKFWSEITGISLTQFYKARIDKRSIGKKTEKKSYKGICRLDYFSVSVFNEITQMYEVILGR